MKKIEAFLKSNVFLILVNGLTFFGFISRGENQIYNTYVLLTFLILLSLILIFFKNTIYTVPFMMGIMYGFNMQNPNLNTISELGFVYLIPVFVVASIVIHWIRFKPKFTKGVLTKPYLWIALAYIGSIFYVNITVTYLQLSLVGFLYLMVYQFFRQTMKTDESYMMRILFFASLLLLAELSYNIGLGFFLENLEKPMRERISLGMRASWFNADFGWANINDVVIHITLLMGAQFYLILKYPKNILLWIFPLLTGFVVFVSASRGGYLSMALSFLFYIPYVIKKTNKWGILNMIYAFIIVGLTLYELRLLVEIAYEIAIQGGWDDLDSFSSSRITLYKHALDIYKEFPVFGGGWESMTDIGNPDRIQVFHSTIFHSLAVMGTFGLLGLFYYFYQTFKYLFTKRNLVKSVILIGILVSQIHGLIDNTMYMIVYTFATLILFSMLENLEQNTI
ncbi:O-antigen ligase family protein [Acholeplasma vituli]|uniref:O-antigen ligase family protein n=1 Tax=Paracholeplasma vituli TaxID=69473 RepID=A0ABT2PY63_9MOLU|nr:O-antigen ligase family protein [Paracholeplasma vituli]MCU0105289.1 O-antigen ligase family protein [Paracholeplasma vituli]